jgi:TolB protein
VTDIEARLRATLGARMDAIEAPRYLDERVRERARRGHLVAIVAATSMIVVVVIGAAIGLRLLIDRAATGPRPHPGPAHSGYPITPHANGRIAYTANGDTGLELHLVKPDGSDDEVIPTPSDGEPWHVAWSPDGSQLALSIFPRGQGDRAIWVMNADGTDPLKLAAAENVSSPTWSPDGAEVVYTADTGARTEIHRAAANGSYDEVVHGEEAEGTFAIFSAQLSPDGLQLLFDRGTDAGFDLFVMSADGGEARPLTTTGDDYDPSWSPDGAKIAFGREEIVESNGRSVATSDIFVMNADGTGVTRLTDGGDEATHYSPTWAPDGTKIAFVAGVTGGPGPVVVMNADGTDENELIHSDVIGVSWGPRP